MTTLASQLHRFFSDTPAIVFFLFLAIQVKSPTLQP